MKKLVAWFHTSARKRGEATSVRKTTTSVSSQATPVRSVDGGRGIPAGITPGHARSRSDPNGDAADASSRQALPDSHDNTAVEKQATARNLRRFPATIEALPAELRLQILLCLSGLEDLKAIVRASPVFHQQYLMDRRRVLARASTATLGSVFVDAYATEASVSLYKPGYMLPRQVVEQFLDEYWQHLSRPDVALQTCTVEDLAGIAGFYLGVVGPLLRRLPAIMLGNLDPSLTVGRLSETERVRLLRGLYRFQLFCNLFCAGEPKRHLEFVLHDDDVVARFLGLFKPWEVDEIGCIATTVKDEYEKFLQAVQWDLHRSHPRFSFWDWPNTPPGAFDLSEEGVCTAPHYHPVGLTSLPRTCVADDNSVARRVQGRHREPRAEAASHPHEHRRPRGRCFVDAEGTHVEVRAEFRGRHVRGDSTDRGPRPATPRRRPDMVGSAYACEAPFLWRHRERATVVLGDPVQGKRRELCRRHRPKGAENLGPRILGLEAPRQQRREAGGAAGVVAP